MLESPSIISCLNQYVLSDNEKKEIDQLLVRSGENLSLESLWELMDYVWTLCLCNNKSPNQSRLSLYYKHAIWLLNGMFIEQDAVSMGHRRAITCAISELVPRRVLDFGGGFGTLARLLALTHPDAEIEVCEPYPPRHGIESCKPFANIRFVSEVRTQSVDVLVSTDVLEHVPDPLALLAKMVDAVRPGGHLFIANCFYPVILCHLPCTFHLRYSFDSFCRALGLEVLGPCEGSHATIYRRMRVVKPNWFTLRAMERQSQLLFPLRELKARYLSPLTQRARLAIAHPLHYPRKLVHALRQGE